MYHPQPVYIQQPAVAQQPIYIQSAPHQPQNNVVMVRRYNSTGWIVFYIVLSILIIAAIALGSVYGIRRRRYWDYYLGHYVYY